MTACRILLAFIVSVLFLLYLPVPTFASPIPKPFLNFSNVGTTISKFSGKVLNKAKSIFRTSSETTTFYPPTTTKSSLRFVLMPRKWSKKLGNDSRNRNNTSTAARENFTPKPTNPRTGLIGIAGNLWNKTKGLLGFTEPTTTKRPVYVVPVLVNWEKLEGSPCLRENASSLQNCTTAAQVSAAGLSWWKIVLIVVATMLVCAGVGMFVMRGRSSKAPFLQWNSVKMRPPKWPRPWFSQSHTTTQSPPRAPAPLPAGATTLPVPTPDTVTVPAPPDLLPQRNNSMYQSTQASGGNPYATPSSLPGQALATWSSNTSEHVHIYETPPYFPDYDYVDAARNNCVNQRNGLDKGHRKV